MNSGKRGAPGAAGSAAGFLAQAATPRNMASTQMCSASRRPPIRGIAPLRRDTGRLLVEESIGKTPRQVGFNRDPIVGRDMAMDAADAIELGDQGAVGGIVRVELERDRR